MSELTVVYGPQHLVLRPGQVAHLGRRDGNDLLIDDPRVSREHVRLSWGSRGWMLESIGRSGTFVAGQPVTQLLLQQVTEAHLAAPDGPMVRFEPAGAPAVVTAMIPPAPMTPGMPGGGLPGAPRPADDLTGAQLLKALRMLMPITTWLRDPHLRQWQRLLVAAYGVLPAVLLILLQKTSDLETLGWVYCLYVAPLWAIVFWYLIRPGPIVKLNLIIAAAIVAAELVLIPALTVPWENALAPASTSHDLFSWILGVGLAEEFTKALPVLAAALVLLNVRHVKLRVPMWMFLATLSGLMFGVYEASTVYVPSDIIDIAKGSAFGIPLFLERIFIDGFQHALWAGVAGFFIGLGANYRRQRIPLWIFGLAVPAVLHGLNDWSLTGVFGSSEWPWIFIQAFSVFLFLGYAASAAVIEREVRHTPAFRGESLLLDPSRAVDPSGADPGSAGT